MRASTTLEGAAMTRVGSWFLVVAIAAVGFGCGSDGGANGTGGSGGNAGASGKGGSGGTGVAGSHGGAGTSGAAGTTGGAGFGGGSGGSAGGHAGSDGDAGAGGHAGSGGGAGSGAGVGGHAGSGGGAGAGGHAGSGGVGGAGGQAGSGGGAGAGGHAGGGGGTGGSGKVCGGIAGQTCSALEFCHFANGQCGAGDQPGQCELSGGALCPQQIVCGCDGHSYSTACAAHANGVDTMSTTSCIPGNGGTGAPCGQDTDCMSGYKCCATGGAVGLPIACRQIAAGGSCPLLP